MVKSIIFILLFSIVSCSQKNNEKIVSLKKESTKKVIIKPEAKSDTIKTVLEETFTDSTQVGIKGKFKLIVEQFRSNDSSYVEIHLFEKRNQKWVLHQQLEYLKDGVTNCEPELKDFNNDGFNDLTFKSSVAARGANEIRKLLIFDKVKKEFILMKNSDHYPNLEYNKLLDCVDAWLVYGGNTTVFLKLEKDSLREFAGVSLENQEREIYLLDKNGKRKTLKKEFVKDLEVYTRFKNYNPLIEETTDSNN
ncbi:hypothetical protein KHA90_19480 [Flavobacterium psychroterrae]|uniref:Lipoprotein n=1 Tax=Flavobacterium psychroterrae TaxID=2133767 RepID=A0ABS5PFX4_9FLAO|nr:hypothetical protein [Flavobacterium psychroterrae]MBS7233204.1 hypothetical protein [Flavobacterium psychroterrae]